MRHRQNSVMNAVADVTACACKIIISVMCINTAARHNTLIIIVVTLSIIWQHGACVCVCVFTARRNNY